MLHVAYDQDPSPHRKRRALCLADRPPLSGTARGNPAEAPISLWVPIAGAL